MSITVKNPPINPVPALNNFRDKAADNIDKIITEVNKTVIELKNSLEFSDKSNPEQTVFSPVEFALPEPMKAKTEIGKRLENINSSAQNNQKELNGNAPEIPLPPEGQKEKTVSDYGIAAGKATVTTIGAVALLPLTVVENIRPIVQAGGMLLREAGFEDASEGLDKTMNSKEADKTLGVIENCAKSGALVIGITMAAADAPFK
jgi:hypothetical protein